MRTRISLMFPLICTSLIFWGCGDDSGVSAKDDESSSCIKALASSSSSVIQDPDPESSADEESSSSKAVSSASGIPYTMECPAGKTCTYAPTEQLNPDITYGEFLDTRDYQMYKTVTIDNQTWMAQNLNYAYTGVKYQFEYVDGKTYTSDSTSWCYENKPSSCAKYGRLYIWAAAIDSVALANDADNPQTCGYGKGCD